jgi:hypothetical protein
MSPGQLIFVYCEVGNRDRVKKVLEDFETVLPDMFCIRCDYDMMFRQSVMMMVLIDGVFM